MQISIKLLALSLLFACKSLPAFELLFSIKNNKPAETESKIDVEPKEKEDTLDKKLEKINAYRSKCLQECGLYRDLSNLIQEYDPIEDKWECETTLKNCADTISSICPLTENKIVLAYRNGKIQIWNLQTNICEKRFETTDKEIEAMCLFPNNKIALGFSNGTLKIWNLSTNECEETLQHPDHKKHVYVENINVLLPLANNKLVAGYGNGKIEIWNLQTNKCEKVLKKHSSLITSICKLPNNEIVSGSFDGTINIWDLETGICKKTLHINNGFVNALCVLTENKLASGNSDGTIKIWDLKNYKLIREFRYKYGDTVRKLFVLPYDKLASAHNNDDIKIWNWQTGKYESTATNGSYTSCLFPKNRLACMDQNGTVKICSNPLYSLTVPIKPHNVKTNTPLKLDKILDDALNELDRK